MGKIVRAHSIPKAGSLARIAEKGHVLAYVTSLENLRRNDGRLWPELVGVNRATTFTGFCASHDNKLFEPVESNR